MSSTANPTPSDRGRASRRGGRGGGGLLLWLGLGCGSVVGLGLTIVLVAMVVLRPYQRAEEQLTEALQQVAPPGTTISGVDLGFPARLTIDRVDLPADPQTGLPALNLRHLTGTTPLSSWWQRRPAVSLSTRVWGGTAAVDAVVSAPLDPEALDLPPLDITATVRDLLVEECTRWLELEGPWRGRVAVDATGTVDVRHPRASVLDGSLSGTEIHIPPLEFSNVVLPANARASMTGQATYRDELVEVHAFQVRGTGYNLDATARIMLREPLESSPIRGRVALQLKEMATWRRDERDAAVAGMMMQLLIQSKGKLHAEIGGTVGEPEATLDESAIIRSLREGGG